MSRRRSGGLIDASGTDGDIEILDVGADVGPSHHEIVAPAATGPRRGIAALGAVVVGALTLLGVVTTGNTPAPEPPAPSVTLPPEPVDPLEAERAAEIAELEATYGVQIGNGPELVWQPVVWNIQTSQFRWVDDGFVGEDGTTEWTITPSAIGPTIGQRQSLSLDYPDYRVQLVDGARLLIPVDETADHILVVVGDDEPIRVELDVSDVEAGADLVPSARYWVDGIVVDQQLVLSGFRQVVTDEESADLTPDDRWLTTVLTLDLVSGSAEPVPLAIDAVSSTIRSPGGVALRWFDDTGQGWLSTSTDGRVWSTIPFFDTEGELTFSGRTLSSFPWSGAKIRRSTDTGRTWQDTRKPFANASDVDVVDDVYLVQSQPPQELAITRWESDQDDPEWHIEPIDRVFNGAVLVSFVPGNGHVLAVVTTTRGIDFYVARTAETS